MILLTELRDELRRPVVIERKDRVLNFLCGAGFGFALAWCVCVMR